MAAQSGQGDGVAFGSPRADDLAGSIPGSLDDAGINTRMGRCLRKHLLLLNGDVQVGAYHELLHPGVLADFQYSALCNNFNCHNLCLFSE